MDAELGICWVPKLQHALKLLQNPHSEASAHPFIMGKAHDPDFRVSA